MNRNILLVSIDSLRYDTYVSDFLGQNDIITKLVENGVVFEQAFAPGPYTEVSVPSTMAGEFLFHDSENPNDLIQRQVECHGTIATALNRIGYSTAGFSPNPHASRYYGLDSGFEYFSDFLESENRKDAVKALASRLKSGDLIEGVRLAANVSGWSIPGFGNQSIPLRGYKSELLEWVQDAESPWFLWVLMLEPHSPYRPTRPYRDVTIYKMLRLNLIWSSLYDRDPTPDELVELKKLYEGATRMTADTIGGLYSALEQLDPVIIIHSDHGEAFGEHGDFGHNKKLFEENIRVPFVIGNIPTTGKVSNPVSLTKLPQIINEIAKTGDINPEDYTSRKAISRIPNHSVSARAKNKKYIAGEKKVYFDLRSDPQEQNPKTTTDIKIFNNYIKMQKEKTIINEKLNSGTIDGM